MNEARIAGLDVGDKYSNFCLLSEDGSIDEEGRFKTTKEGVEGWARGKDGLRVVLEVGTHSRWISNQLKGLGLTPLVANARHLSLIYGRDNKTDRSDAEMLARLGRADESLLHVVHHRENQAQQHLAVVRARNCMVEARTKLVNHIRGVTKSWGVRLPRTSTRTLTRVGVLEKIPEEVWRALLPLLASVTAMTKTIDDYDEEIARLSAEEYPETEALQRICGVGPLTSLAFVLTIEDPSRFSNARSVGSFLGLVRKLDQSGERDKELGITKAGDPYLRKLLVQSSHHILGPMGKDSDLRRWGLRLAERGGRRAKARAVVAVARKLAVLMLTLWRSGKEYVPLQHPEPAAAVETRALDASAMGGLEPGQQG